MRHALLFLSSELLGKPTLLLHTLSVRRLFPIRTPHAVRVHEPRAQQQPARSLHQTHLAHPFSPHVVPSRPASREALVHEPLHAQLLQVRHALLALSLELLLHLALHSFVGGTSGVHGLPRLLELPHQLTQPLLQLLTFHDLGLQLLLMRHAALRNLLVLPVASPAAVRRHKFRPHKVRTRLPHQPTLARDLEPRAVPSRPRTRDGLVAQPLHAQLLQVRHALLFLSLQLFSHCFAIGAYRTQSAELIARTHKLSVERRARFRFLCSNRSRCLLLVAQTLHLCLDGFDVLPKPVAFQNDGSHPIGKCDSPSLTDRGRVRQVEQLSDRIEPLDVAQPLLQLRALPLERGLHLFCFHIIGAHGVLESVTLCCQLFRFELLLLASLRESQLEHLAHPPSLQHSKLSAHPFLDAQLPLMFEMPLCVAERARRRAELILQS